MRDSGLRVLHFTDTHIYADAAHLFARIDTQLSFLATRDKALSLTRNYDLILVTGDLAAEAEEPAYRWLAEQLSIFELPIYCLPGNHDVNTVMEPLVKAAGWYFGGNHTVGGWHIILLDTCVQDAAHGCLNAAEIERLDIALAQHSQLPTLVCLHHHPVPMMSAWMDTMQLHNADEFWQVIAKYPQVRIVLWGHVHQNFDTYRNGVRLLATPSTCVQFAARSVNFAIDSLTPGFRYLQLLPSGGLDTVVVRT